MALDCPRLIARWKGASVSFTGRGHIEKGLPCQDVSSALPDDEPRIIVVSDGAGSAKHSEHGASGVVEATIRTLQTSVPWVDLEDVRERVLTACKTEINVRANALACHECDLAATLAFAAVAEDVFVAGNLGDGVVAAFRGQIPEILLKPERGEFANETMFLTSENVNKHFRIVSDRLEDYDGFAILSDGAAECLYQRHKSLLAPALPKILEWFDQKASIQVKDAIRDKVMPIIAKRTMDDCSLAVLKFVRLAPNNLNSKNADFLAELLETGNKRGLRNRLKILEYISKEDITDNLKIAEAVDLSVGTVRNHRRILESLLQ